MTRTTDRWVLIVTILTSGMGFIDSTALNVAIPTLQASLNASGSDIFWIINSYLLFLSSLILIGGAMGDLYGRKRVFGIGIVIFTIASILCGLASDVGLLIAARALQGIGGALMVPGSLSIISAYFDDSRRGEAIGTWSAIGTLTTLAGPLLGGYLAEQGQWRAIFFINVPIAAIALFGLIRYVPESRDTERTKRLDLIGAALIAFALGGVSYGFLQTAESGFTPITIAAIISGLIALGLFIVAETRIAQPMIPLKLFRSRTFSGTNLLTFLLYGALGAVFLMLPLNLIQVQGYTETQASLAILPQGLLLMVISRRAGAFASQRGARLPLTVGPFLIGCGFAWLAFIGVTAGINDYWLTFFPAIVLNGVGLGITVAPLTTAVMNAVPAGRSGIASGVNNAVARTGSALAVAILGAIALLSFVGAVERGGSDLALIPDAQTALIREARNFGNAQVPELVPIEQRDAIETLYDQAFIAAFRSVMAIGAALAFGSAALGWISLRASDPTATIAPESVL